jgi:carbon storage regulator
VITILRVKGQSVRIGIEAPREVCVIRAELPKTADQSEAPESVSATTESASDRAAARTTPRTDSRRARSPARGFRGAGQVANSLESPLGRMVSRRTSPSNQAGAFQAYA